MLMRNVALADSYSIHCHFADAMIVHERGHKYKHVEDLMRLELQNKQVIGISMGCAMMIVFFASPNRIFTQMSHLPGNHRSGTRRA